MSQRTSKVASTIQQLVAAEITRLPESARYTVTKVDVTPDMRQATVWIGVLAKTERQAGELFTEAESARSDLQAAVAQNLTTKFTPRLALRRDVSGEYADSISRLIKGL